MTTQIAAPSALPPPPLSLPVDPERLHRLTLDQYHRMIAVGLLKKSDRLVLLDGFLVKKMTLKPRHVTACYKIAEALRPVLPAGWYLRQEWPVTLPGGPEGFDSEPEPDLVVVSGTIEDHGDRHPGPDEIALVVQVAASSLADDRKGLSRLASLSIPTAWIVNLNEDTIEVYTDPTGAGPAPRYQAMTLRSRTAMVSFWLRTRLGTIESARLIGPFPVDDLIPRGRPTP